MRQTKRRWADRQTEDNEESKFEEKLEWQERSILVNPCQTAAAKRSKEA